MAKAEEQRKLAEINFKKAMDERGRGEQLCQKMEEERRKVQKLEDLTTRSLEGKGEPILGTMRRMSLLMPSLGITEKQFLDKFVCKYEDVLPELKDIYSRAMLQKTFKILANVTDPTRVWSSSTTQMQLTRCTSA